MRIRHPDSFWAWIRDPGWKNSDRDNYPGSATLEKTTQTSTYRWTGSPGSLPVRLWRITTHRPLSSFSLPPVLLISEGWNENRPVFPFRESQLNVLILRKFFAQIFQCLQIITFFSLPHLFIPYLLIVMRKFSGKLIVVIFVYFRTASNCRKT
jgi:hypothetical protein